MSLIDLDDSLPMSSSLEWRPSTATSTTSTMSELRNAPFGLEETIRPLDSLHPREPSIYVDDAWELRSQASVTHDVEVRNASEVDVRYPSLLFEPSALPQPEDTELSSQSLQPPLLDTTERFHLKMPLIPDPPSPHVMGGENTRDEARDELRRLLSSFSDHLDAIGRMLSGLATEGENHAQVDCVMNGALGPRSKNGYLFRAGRFNSRKFFRTDCEGQVLTLA